MKLTAAEQTIFNIIKSYKEPVRCSFILHETKFTSEMIYSALNSLISKRKIQSIPGIDSYRILDTEILNIISETTE